ncbi:hypothetical protein SUDANB121_01478 [Nocardiopsis dassonvillei]
MRGAHVHSRRGHATITHMTHRYSVFSEPTLPSAADT